MLFTTGKMDKKDRPYLACVRTMFIVSKFDPQFNAYPRTSTPTPWLTLLLVLGKSRVKQIRVNQVI